MLIVVEDGNITLFLQLALDFKAAGRGDILQIDAAEGAGDQVDGIDEFIHVLGLHAQGEGVHIAKGLEQGAFALHDRHTGLGADVTQTQHGGAVGDDRAQVVAAGQLIGFLHILLDLQTGLGNAGSIGQGQVILRGNGHLGDDLDLAAPFLVKPQGLFCVIHSCILQYMIDLDLEL